MVVVGIAMQTVANAAELSVTVSGRVVDDETGRPIAHVPVSIKAFRPRIFGMGQYVVVAATTSAPDGSFCLSATLPARRMFMVVSDNRNTSLGGGIVHLTATQSKFQIEIRHKRIDVNR
jgi:hypothetical protein